jgi:hypothetical protein
MPELGKSAQHTSVKSTMAKKLAFCKLINQSLSLDGSKGYVSVLRERNRLWHYLCLQSFKAICGNVAMYAFSPNVPGITGQ